MPRTDMVLFNTGAVYKVRVGDDSCPARLISQAWWCITEGERHPFSLHQIENPYEKRGFPVLRMRDGADLSDDQAAEMMSRIPIPINYAVENARAILEAFEVTLPDLFMLDLIEFENFVKFW